MTYEELYGEPLPDRFEYFFSNLMTSRYIYRNDMCRSHLVIRSAGNSTIHTYGIISMIIVDWPKIIHFLDKHFRNPFKPTEEERVLFEIEHGFSYPIEAR